jgi:hypothetical protein
MNAELPFSLIEATSLRSSIFPVVRHLSRDIDVNPIATNRITLSGLVRFVPVNRRERERMASVP